MFLKEMLRFYYSMSLNELRLMNERDYYRGLSYNSLLYLNVITMMEDCTVTRLAAALHVTKPGVTLKVNELVRQGAVVKRRSGRDRRVVQIALSPGMEKTIHMYNDVFAEIGRNLEKAYSPEQLALFCTILRSISEHEWQGAAHE